MEGEAVAVDDATHLRRAEDALKAGDALQAAASFAAAGDAAPFESRRSDSQTAGRTTRWRCTCARAWTRRTAHGARDGVKAGRVARGPAREPRVRRGAGHARGGGGDEGLAPVLRRARLAAGQGSHEEAAGGVRPGRRPRALRGDRRGRARGDRAAARARGRRGYVPDAARERERVAAERSRRRRLDARLPRRRGGDVGVSALARVPGDGVGRRRRARERSARRNLRDAPRRNQRVHEFTR